MSTHIIKDVRGVEMYRREAPTFKDAVEKITRETKWFFCADLSGADLAGVDLRNLNLIGADLSGCNLVNTDFRHTSVLANFFRDTAKNGAKFSEEIPDNIRVVPKEGDFVAWKKCRYGVLVKLLIPASAERSNGFSGRCRASKVVVLDVIGAEIGVSMWDSIIEYRVGEAVFSDAWDPSWWDECTNGIHFFMTRKEAEEYEMG